MDACCHRVVIDRAERRRRPRHRDGADRPVADQPAALAELQGKRARLLVALDIPGAVHRRRCLPRSIANDNRCSCVRMTAAGTCRPSSPIRRPTFGGDFETAADYRDPYLQKLIAEKDGKIVWPPIRFSYSTPQSRSADAGAVAANLDADRRAVQERGRSARA